jgi:hypothetical protein
MIVRQNSAGTWVIDGSIGAVRRHKGYRARILWATGAGRHPSTRETTTPAPQTRVKSMSRTCHQSLWRLDALTAPHGYL